MGADRNDPPRPCRRIIVAGASAAAMVVLVAAGIGSSLLAWLAPVPILAAVAWALAVPTPATGANEALHLSSALERTTSRLQLESALVTCARTIAKTDDPFEVEHALSQLLSPVDCDAVIICRNIETIEGPTAEIVYAAGEIGHLTATMPWSRLPEVRERLAAGHTHAFDRVEDLNGPDRSVYENGDAGIIAAAEIPVFAGGAWVGHVSLIRTRPGRRWLPEDLSLLSSLAEMTGLTWERQQNLTRLKDTVRERDRSLGLQVALGDVSRILLEDSSDDAIARALGAVMEPIGASVAYVRTAREHPLYGAGLSTAAVSVAHGGSPPRYIDADWGSWPRAHAAAMAGRVVAIDDVRHLEPEIQRWYTANAPGVGAEMALPIISDTAVTGVVVVSRPDAHQWTDAERSTLDLMTHLIGIARSRELARRGLEDLVKTKDRFIASVSHELRTPMAVVLGLSQELRVRRDQFSEDEVTEFIDLIARQSHEVSDIIEDLLVAARVNAESITMLPEAVRLDELLATALPDLSSEHTRRIASVDLEPVATFADPLRVRQIIRNLLSNSHRHGGGRVYLSVRQLDGEAIVEVSDDGDGIPPEMVEESFERYTAGSELDGRPASIGLGLTVSRQLARLMGGDLLYVPRPMPTFRLRLPLGEAPTTETDDDVRTPGSTVTS